MQEVYLLAYLQGGSGIGAKSKSALGTEMLVILVFEVLLMIINNKFLTREASRVGTRTRLLNSGMFRLRMNTAPEQARPPGHCLTNTVFP